MNNIKEIREKKGLSQQELANLVSMEYQGADVVLIGKLERDDIYPGDYLRKAICDALNCDEGELLIDPHIYAKSTYDTFEETKRPKEKPKADADRHCVYRFTFPNGKVYIGQTKSGNHEKRWSGGRGYQSSGKVYGAILLYGWQNIKREILYDGLTQEEATAREIEEIKKHHAVADGYNAVCDYNGRRRE